MIQYKVFVGTITEVEAAFNAWAASLAQGANVNSGPLTPLLPNSIEDVKTRQYLKEVVYVLPQRSNGQIAVPQVMPRGVRRGEPA